MIRPYASPPPRPRLALVGQDGGGAIREGDSGPHTAAWTGLLGDRGWRVYLRTETAEGLLAQGQGAVLYWNAQPIRWMPDPERPGASAIVLGARLPLPDDGDTLAAFGRWADWLHDEGATAAGSFGGSGLSLLRAKLTEPLATAMGAVPPITYALGGRQEDAGPRPARYHGSLAQHDIQAAYASQLGSVFYGAPWEQAAWTPGLARWAEREPGRMLYVRARVGIPELPAWLAPLPCRPRNEKQRRVLALLADAEYPRGRTVQGVWSWEELRQAEAVGCQIKKCLDCWLQPSPERPFAAWHEAVLRGRELPGLAATLAKVTGNSTWGQLAISRGRRLLRWKKPGARRTSFRVSPLPGGGNPSMRAYDLAEWICGATRSRLLAGMTAVGEDLICAHTDGLWSQGRGVRGWRQRETADEIEILSAQQLRYRLTGRPWRYTVAGVPESEIEEWWDARWSLAGRDGVREL